MGLSRNALIVIALLLPGSSAMAQQTIYCCDDERGRPVCGDVLPTVCFGKAYREISPQGTVRRHVAAPLTAEEIARRDAEQRRLQEEEAILAAQRRIDRALLETYQNLDDIDFLEARALAEVERELEVIAEREEELAEQRERLMLETEFYVGRELPRELATGLRLIDTELAAYQSVRAAKQVETQSIRERFAADRRRYAELIAAGDGRRR
jgi:hypothetical protein